jgi:RNA polymerase sigma-70 factor (ECF subfamily)
MPETLALPAGNLVNLPAALWTAFKTRERDRTVPNLENCLHRLQKGDESALEAFIEATQDMAYRLAYSILGERELCKDVLQETYLTVYQKIAQLRQPAAFKGWFCKILVNRARQQLRGQKMWDELPLDLPTPDPTEATHSRLDLQQAMQSLSPLDQTVLTMREVLELSYQEIADSLELPLGTVRSRLFNARARLLTALKTRS